VAARDVWPFAVVAGALALLAGGAMTSLSGSALEKRPGILASLSSGAAAAAQELARLAAAEGLPLLFTSGRRTPLDQASAMLDKVRRGEDLRSLYRSAGATLDRLFAAPQTTAAWASILAAAPPISRHLTGDAADIRTAGLSDAQVYRLGELAIAAGFGRALRESDHLHVQL
jgi:hypothetical protein